MHVSMSDFASLYSLYSWPNVVLPVVGGALVDTLMGVRIGGVFFSVILLIGGLAT